MQLFDDIARTTLRTPRAEEDRFSYLNISARPAAGQVRAFLTDLVARYPEHDRKALISRLRSSRNHEPAVFELLVHEALVRSGFTIVEIEPVLPGRTTSPDFLVRSPDGVEFIVECVVANGRSEAEDRALKRRDAAVDGVSTTPSPKHILTVNVRGAPDKPVKISGLRGKLSTWIKALPDGPQAKRAAPFVFEEHGLRLSVRVMTPRRRPAGPDDRSVGSISYPIQAHAPGEDLRGSLGKKASKYDDLEKPYIIAINDAQGFGEQHLMDALMGSTSAVQVGDQFEARRLPDGLWTEGGRPRRRGVSAVLWFRWSDAWRPWGRAIRLVRNPYAQYPLPEIGLPFPALNPVNGNFDDIAGEQGPALFGLPADWPVDD